LDQETCKTILDESVREVLCRNPIAADPVASPVWIRELGA